jgi:hypothetical protein
MSETHPTVDAAEDDGVLAAADSLLSDDLDADVLDTGIDAGDRYRGATAYGTTHAEELRGESLDQRLSDEEAEADPDLGWAEGNDPVDEDDVALPRAGRLVAPDDGAQDDREPDAIGVDVGVDGGGATAEEAAVHLTTPPDWT